MIIICPNCFSKVLISNGSICPSCSKNINDVDSANSDMVPIDLKSGQSLPDICFLCGENTNTYVKIKSTNRKNKNILISVIVLMALLLIIAFLLFLKSNDASTEIDAVKFYEAMYTWIFGLPVLALIVVLILFILSTMSKGRSSYVNIKMPICKSCNKNKAVIPKYVDFDNYSFTFVVHKKFRNILKKKE